MYDDSIAGTVMPLIYLSFYVQPAIQSRGSDQLFKRFCAIRPLLEIENNREDVWGMNILLGNKLSKG